MLEQKARDVDLNRLNEFLLLSLFVNVKDLQAEHCFGHADRNFLCHFKTNATVRFSYISFVVDNPGSVVIDVFHLALTGFSSLRGRLLAWRSLGFHIGIDLLLDDSVLAFNLDQIPVFEEASVDLLELNFLLIAVLYHIDPVILDFKIVTSFMLKFDLDFEFACVDRTTNLAYAAASPFQIGSVGLLLVCFLGRHVSDFISINCIIVTSLYI